MLNPALDSTALANAFSEDGRVRIDNLLLTESAAEVLSLCTSQLEFDYLFFANGKNQVFSTAQIAALDPKARAKMQQALFDQAAEGVGFFIVAAGCGMSQQVSSWEQIRSLRC
jgi:hypothetical protein